MYTMNGKWKKFQLKKPDKTILGMIKDFLIRNKEVLLQCVLAVILYRICSYKLENIVMPVVLDDEYGYWANSSFLMGIEWSSVTQNVAYYSYGYSLILVLVRLVARLIGSANWASIYSSACVVNRLFIVGSFFLAARICKRYMHNLNWLTRSVVCFVVMIYPANIFYSHLTLTECALTFMFWVFIYIMMRVTDSPNVLNHIAFGATSIYIYVIHQRALSVLITAVMIVVFLKLVRVSRMRDVAVFSVTVYICFLVQAAMKKNLQSVLYLGNPHVGFGELISYMFTKKAAVMLVMMFLALLLLYFVDKGRARLACIVLAIGIAAAIVYILGKGLSNTTEQVEFRIAVNDFVGQWSKMIKIFSKYGLVRLGTSIVGKWFYLATATGLVICWGIRDLFIEAFWMTIDSIKKAFCAIMGKENETLERIANDYRSHIWFLGVFLAWIGTFLICAIYKEGLYKVDDLVNGRYIEYATGILIIYSMDRLLSDKHWFMMLVVCLALYLTAGWYCQYVYDTLQRTEFELVHAVVIGRIFRNHESPTGKIRELVRYVVPLSLSFILLTKFFSNYISRFRFNKKIVMLRCIIALMIPMITWRHISYWTIDDYICVVYDRQTGELPQVAFWVNLLENGEKIYFIQNSLHYKKSLLLQFVLMDKVIEYTSFEQLSFDEDAIYVMQNKLVQDPKVIEKCEVVRFVGNYAIVINKNQEIIERWNFYKNALQS